MSILKRPIRIGDLVKFESRSWVFEHANERYANPGVVIDIDPTTHTESYEILWADGKITTEFDAYLDGSTEIITGGSDNDHL